jgi:calcium-dependent protein kinase
MLFTMLCGQYPFHRDNEIELLKLVRKGKFQFQPSQVWAEISALAHELIRKILSVKVHDRCSADQAFHHDWCMLTRRDSTKEGDEAITKQLVEGMHRFLTNNRLKRVALRIIARQIDDDSIKRLRSVFLTMDADNSGSLTVDEMTEATNKLDVGEMVRGGMVAIMCQLDPTGSGVVEYTEFLAATMSKSQYLQEDVCRAAFIRLDSDGDGILSRKDLGRLLSDKDGMRDAGLTGASLTELISEMEHIMEEADGNNDGGVSFEEFMELMNDDGPLPSKSAIQARAKRSSYTLSTSNERKDENYCSYSSDVKFAIAATSEGIIEKTHIDDGLDSEDEAY